MTGSLFDPEPSFDRDAFAGRLASLARERIFIGTSSWKYEGWFGQIYDRANYLSRGKFSRKVFQSECLKEYASIFPTVCGDFAFYQFPTPEFWQRLFALVPPPFRFAFKIPEQITAKVFPSRTRYGAQASLDNPSFLDFHLLNEAFLKPLAPYHDQVCALIFEFGALSRRAIDKVEVFLEALDPFLAALPTHFRYAVEIRNPEFLQPNYFACLRSHGVTHVFNAWTRMPELGVQFAMPESFTADFLVTRALLSVGRPYEDAVRLFSPYAEIRDENPQVRDTIREMIQRARIARNEAYVYVNNRFEGNAPATIKGLID